MKKLLLLILAAALLLTACGETLPPTEPQPNQRDIMNAAMRAAMELIFEPITVSHGEDYVIEWKDEGMEAHIRFLLDKPDGDIFHSDVWDVQFLLIDPSPIGARDIFLKEPPMGKMQFDLNELLLVENKEGIWIEYDAKQFPVIESLRDLRHFDSLQILQTNGIVLTDLTGVEQCPNLICLTLTDTKLTTLEPLSQMPWLEQLNLHSGGSLDLTPIVGLPALRNLTLCNCELESLEPLTTLPSLYELDLGVDAVYPSLEPLTRSTVKFLSLWLSKDGRGQYDYLDYESLARIPNLTWLDIMNHTAFGVEDCTALLKGCPNLRYLNIWYTGAAEAIADGEYAPDTSHLEAFATKPY